MRHVLHKIIADLEVVRIDARVVAFHEIEPLGRVPAPRRRLRPARREVAAMRGGPRRFRPVKIELLALAIHLDRRSPAHVGVDEIVGDEVRAKRREAEDIVLAPAAHAAAAGPGRAEHRAIAVRLSPPIARDAVAAVGKPLRGVSRQTRRAVAVERGVKARVDRVIEHLREAVEAELAQLVALLIRGLVMRDERVFAIRRAPMQHVARTAHERFVFLLLPRDAVQFFFPRGLRPIIHVGPFLHEPDRADIIEQEIIVARPLMRLRAVAECLERVDVLDISPPRFAEINGRGFELIHHHREEHVARAGRPAVPVRAHIDDPVERRFHHELAHDARERRGRHGVALVGQRLGDACKHADRRDAGVERVVVITRRMDGRDHVAVHRPVIHVSDPAVEIAHVFRRHVGGEKRAQSIAQPQLAIRSVLMRLCRVTVGLRGRVPIHRARLADQHRRAVAQRQLAFEQRIGRRHLFRHALRRLILVQRALRKVRHPRIAATVGMHVIRHQPELLRMPELVEKVIAERPQRVRVFPRRLQLADRLQLRARADVRAVDFIRRAEKQLREFLPQRVRRRLAVAPFPRRLLRSRCVRFRRVVLLQNVRAHQPQFPQTNLLFLRRPRRCFQRHESPALRRKSHDRLRPILRLESPARHRRPARILFLAHKKLIARHPAVHRLVRTFARQHRERPQLAARAQINLQLVSLRTARLVESPRILINQIRRLPNRIALLAHRHDFPIPLRHIRIIEFPKSP